MEQLALNIVHCLSYSVSHFIKHAGVTDIFPLVDTNLKQDQFGLYFIYGGRRTGKTHLSIALSDRLSQISRYSANVRLLEGDELPEFLTTRQEGRNEAILIDNADNYLRKIGPGGSGGFVSLVESLRRAGGALFLFSASHIKELPCDEHIISRLVAGFNCTIGYPEESDLAPLIKVMAAQRGLKLEDRAVQFICKRSPRDISQIEGYFERLDYLSQTFGKSIRFPLLGDAF